MEELRMKKHSRIKREIIDTYIVFSNNDESRNIIVFKDINRKSRVVRVNNNIREEYRRRKSEENSQKIKYSRYIEHSVLTDISLCALNQMVLLQFKSRKILFLK